MLTSKSSRIFNWPCVNKHDNIVKGGAMEIHRNETELKRIAIQSCFWHFHVTTRGHYSRKEMSRVRLKVGQMCDYFVKFTTTRSWHRMIMLLWKLQTFQIWFESWSEKEIAWALGHQSKTFANYGNFQAKRRDWSFLMKKWKSLSLFMTSRNGKGRALDQTIIFISEKFKSFLLLSFFRFFFIES